MAYSDFTLADVIRTFHLTMDDEHDLFTSVHEVEASPLLAETLRETTPLALAIHTEKARSELIIAPILVELRKILRHQISLFSGVDFTIDPAQGLNGVCDFIIARSPEQLFISAPIVIIVEAKNENIKGGLAQCIAAMIAARLVNQREGTGITVVYGAVTTGNVWRFLQLDQETIRLDRQEHYLDQVEKILGILVHMVGAEPLVTA
jgi:hypothetical protein